MKKSLFKRLRGILLVSFLILTIITLDCIRRDVFTRQEDRIDLHILYTSEKRGWINSIANDFSPWFQSRNPGLDVRLRFEVTGTRTSMISILSGESKPVIWSPASSVWLPLFDYAWKQKFDTTIIDINASSTLVSSPIVIGTWESYIQDHNLSSWQDLYELSKTDLRLAHTSAQESNSGYMAVLLKIAAAANKKPQDIIMDDLENQTVQEWVRQVESAAVLYGSSTGFLAKQAANLGPSGLNVIIVYESLIMETAKDGEAEAKWGEKIVAVYPDEGTLWSDHPLVIFDATWVSEKQLLAAREFKEFLLSKERQLQAMDYGFRPGNETLLNDHDIQLKMNEVFDSDLGVSINITVPRFGVPSSGEVLDRIPDVWVKTRAETLDSQKDSDYFQVNYNYSPLLVISSLIILTSVYKKRRDKHDY